MGVASRWNGSDYKSKWKMIRKKGTVKTSDEMGGSIDLVVLITWSWGVCINRRKWFSFGKKERDITIYQMFGL